MKDLVSFRQETNADPIGDLSKSVDEFMDDNGAAIAGVASILVLAGALVNNRRKKKAEKEEDNNE